MFIDKIDFVVAGQFNASMFKGNMKDDVNLYQSYVLKIVQIILCDPILNFFPFITLDIPISLRHQ